MRLAVRGVSLGALRRSMVSNLRHSFQEPELDVPLLGRFASRVSEG